MSLLSVSHCVDLEFKKQFLFVFLSLSLSLFRSLFVRNSMWMKLKLFIQNSSFLGLGIIGLTLCFSCFSVLLFTEKNNFHNIRSSNVRFSNYWFFFLISLLFNFGFSLFSFRAIVKMQFYTWIVFRLISIWFACFLFRLVLFL